MTNMFYIVYILNGKTNSHRYLSDFTVCATSFPLYNNMSEYGVSSSST